MDSTKCSAIRDFKHMPHHPCFNSHTDVLFSSHSIQGKPNQTDPSMGPKPGGPPGAGPGPRSADAASGTRSGSSCTEEPPGGCGEQQRWTPRLARKQRSHLTLFFAPDRTHAQQQALSGVQDRRSDRHHRRPAKLQYMHAVPLHGVQPMRIQPQPSPH